MTDLVTRLRALADMHYPAKLTVVLREAADALEAEETRRMMLNTSNGEWSKRFHAAEAEAAALRSALQGILEGADHPASGTKAYVKLVLTQPGPGAALLERVKKLEKVAEKARSLETRDVAPDGRAIVPHQTVLDLLTTLAALEEKP